MAILSNTTLPLVDEDVPYFPDLFWHNITVLNILIATMVVTWISENPHGSNCKSKCQYTGDATVLKHAARWW